MKVNDFAYAAAMKALALLEERHHYTIPEATRKEIAQAVRASTNELIKSASG